MKEVIEKDRTFMNVGRLSKTKKTKYKRGEWLWQNI